MSSYSGGDVIVAPVLSVGAVAVGAAYAVGMAAYGVGYGVYKVGEAAVELNKEADRIIEENKNRKIEEARQRLARANSTKEKMAEMEKTILKEANEKLSVFPRAKDELEAIKKDLITIQSIQYSEDVNEIEFQNMEKYSRLMEIVRRIEHLSSIYKEIGEEFEKNKLHDSMNQLRIVIAASDVSETRGKELVILDEDSRKRKSLNNKLMELAAKIIFALDFFDKMETSTGIPKASRILFSEKLLGTDRKIEELLSIDITNEELENGILELEETVRIFNTIYPTLLQEKVKKEALYTEYARIFDLLLEEKKEIKEFDSYKEIEAELKRIEERKSRIEKCHRLYKKMGKDAYICYAIDTELSKLGYTVQKREKIEEISGKPVEHGRMGDKTSPFYLQNDGELTQFYQVSSNCILQLIVHKDGSISMQTLSDHGETEKIKEVQEKHCSQLNGIKRKLKENWFISLDNLKEEDGADIVTEIEEWRRNHSDRKDRKKFEEKAKNTKHMHIQNN